MKNLPTAFQRSALWTAITALSITLVGALAIGFIYLSTQVIGFLQPILMPFAVAGVLAYLLEPGVAWLERKGLKRQRAVLIIFAVFSMGLFGLGWWILPKLGEQTSNLAKKIPGYTVKARAAVLDFATRMEREYGIPLPAPLADLVDGSKSNSPTPAPQTSSPSPDTVSAPTVPAAPASPALGGITQEPNTTQEASLESQDKEPPSELDFDLKALLTGDWVKTTLPTVLSNAWKFIRSTFGGFLGIFGFLLSLIIVPLYLYYFLIESAKIKTQWSDYLPLRASAFKDEVVSCLNEINRYLIAFFRGQLFVSVINGIATGAGLMIIGLDFGLLIGLALCVAGIIPYLGIALCWIPAVIIGAVQGGSALIPGDPWWALPLAVSIIFIMVQQIDGLFITPRIVGEAVGLHPMTVIASVLVWTLLLGGLLGAILAVPMTASVKVLFQRYIWRARIAPRTVGGARQGTVSAEVL
ncbi:AI-2E family transporter [Prosthecobacter dejongeii]|uniref:Putative PurR-regulated permease PerM n=1 Tax=Prosthecobacter dejongeii TaxID=48465 RepID=A0A7W7YIT6_9BACT|nr:AI-2E family transporter [Prosthecobacter dejongeii]MBB5036959.1 putative PurR-regulated permease PerM [Prosthecobacter dejongeii]